MDNSTNTPGSECTVLDEHESSSQGEDELEQALSRVNELLDEATQGMEDDTLTSAVAVLRETIRDEQNEEARTKAEITLIKALVTRFARYGWVNDLDEGVELLLRERTNPAAFTDEDCAGSAASALDSLRDYRESIDVSKLGTAIAIASEALASECHGATKRRGELLLRAGNALVLKYLVSDDEGDLALAEASFQSAKQVFRSGDPMLFTTLLNLQHIASIKLVDCKGEKSVGLLDLKQWRDEMEAEDEKGRNAYMLGTQLMGGDKPQLEESILQFQQSLSFRPPGHPRRHDTLAKCAIALGTRFRSTSDFCDLEQCITLGREALSYRPSDHPQRPISGNNLASWLFTRFQRKGELDDLKESVTLYREALDRLPAGHPFCLKAIENLAISLITRFRHRGDLQDLEEGVSLRREALELCPAGHPDHARSLDNLANSLLTRFNHVGDIRDLEASGTLHRKALELRPAGHVDRPRSLNNLASSLFTLFQRKGDIHDLNESVVLYREALHLRPRGHPNRFDSLSNLIMSLCARFDRNGDLDDLEERISLQTEMLALRLPTHHDRPRLVINLATSLFTRFERKGDFENLTESVTLFREAVNLSPAGHSSRFSSLTNLASSLFTRFRHEDNICDLEESITLYREALDLCPVSDRPTSLSNLASSLSTRFYHQGDVRDLEESVTLYKEALELRPEGHPDRFSSLNNLATSFAARFQYKGEFYDLEKCVSLHREAVSLLPEGHRTGPSLFTNLARSLFTRFLHKGNFRDLDESITLHRKVLDFRPAGHPDRPSSLSNLANSLCARFDHKGDFCDLEECIALHREALALRHTDLSNRSTSLSDLAICLFTRFQHKRDFCDLEECITLQREALDLNPAGHLSRPNSLSNLANSLLTRFGHSSDLRDLEECILLHKEALSLRPPGHPDHPSSLNNLASSLSVSFEYNGGTGDLEGCIVLLRDALRAWSQAGISPSAKSDSSTPLADHPLSLAAIWNLVEVLKIKYHATDDNEIQDEIFQLLSSGAQSQGSPPLARLRHAIRWSSTCRVFGRLDTALEAYSYGVDILPQLASLDLTLEQRQNVLVHAKHLSRDAVQCAIEQGELEKAVIFLSTARSVFWSQALQLQGSLEQLHDLHPDLASELHLVTRQLEIATHQNVRPDSMSAQGSPPPPYLLAQRREEIIAQIRAIDGFHDFLLPPSFDILRNTTRENPIVFLNASEYGCDILILKEDGTLHRHPLSTDVNRIVGLSDAVQQLSQGRAVGQELQRKVDNFCESRNIRLQLHRKNKMRRTVDDDFKEVLETLWDVVTEPVIKILGLQKTDNPKRIWWCPTGPFAFLPIHAAGVYSDNPEASDCLSDYVVSSYCSSPQDLIAPPPTPNLDYEMLVVVEPGDSGPRTLSLPFTLEELKRIQRLVPDGRHLVTRIGSAETPSIPDAILGHINTASIVHFGCHGSQDFSSPLDSSLMLSGGCLTMRSLIRGCRASNAALAYLSACETAMGDQERPDESLSLAGTMQFAGFRSVVATMWSIHDEDAPLVTDVFYRHLFRRGTAAPPDITDAAYSLHLAVKKLRDLGRPFHQWVPFVHHGI
ncbi:hypothetical protein CC1G_04001 [Coprinopsis cinerea okayama7|uniref:CHAT domain-containing protein n=1 Tax=Coprinopsis cinerea (strain Okayama-7 / 130 / ATCC MYA-4618 / FGSC 9003) TaxID=240176 RepID=A8N8F4_COPC7|nr:hypothetical protein CC1G_04001 [Coprinopsis cinerea okayama7\|eukprot:XP_001831110.2 hypothetical protein CC1G_04001 [Coprinopsis cinerea okayama7\